MDYKIVDGGSSKQCDNGDGSPSYNYYYDKKENPTISRMGLFGWRPRFLEFLNKPIVFVAVFGLGNLFTVMSFGVLSVYLSTLEKTFNLNTKESGLILLGNDISGLFASLILANYCSSRKIRWISAGMFAVVISCILPVLATLFAEYPTLDPSAFIPSISGVGGLCEKTFGPPSPSVAEYAIKNHGLFWLFVAGSLVLGIGGSPPGIAGPTYMDEMYTQKDFGVAISALYILSFIGFPIAVIFGAATLNTYVTLNPPEGMDPSRPEWVGAWWLGFLVPGVVILVVSFIVVLFPVQMPAAKIVLEEKIRKGITTVSEKKTELTRSLKEITRDTIPVIKRIVTNKPLNCLVFGDALIFLQIGSISYLPKIYAIAFRLGFSEVGSVIGISNAVAFVLGLVLGGVIMKVKDWHPKKLFLIYAVMVFVSSPFHASLFMHCDANTYAGVDVRYPSLPEGSASLVDSCNNDCRCNTAFPSFVCDESAGTTYFSQCHAGCSGGETLPDNNKIVAKYTNCSCVEGASSDLGGEVVPGQCGVRCQTKLIISLTLTVVGTMINFSGYAAHATVYQRVVAEVDRTAAQGWRQFVTRVIGTLPAPILFGYLIDNSCTVWREVDGVRGNCWVYDVESLIYWFVVVQLVLRAGACTLYFAGWYLYPSPTKEEQAQYEGNGYRVEEKQIDQLK